VHNLYRSSDINRIYIQYIAPQAMGIYTNTVDIYFSDRDTNGTCIFDTPRTCIYTYMHDFYKSQGNMSDDNDDVTGLSAVRQNCERFGEVDQPRTNKLLLLTRAVNLGGWAVWPYLPGGNGVKMFTKSFGTNSF
jgi:hypothetical protein